MKINYFGKMSDTMRLWVIPVILGFSLILSGLGIIFILDMRALAAIISGFMFLSGLLGVSYVYANRGRFDGWGFYFTLAIFDFVLGVLLIVTPEIKMTTISILLSLWILFQGLGKIIYSLDIQKLGIKNWDSDLATGVLFVAYGAISIFLLSLSPAFVLLTTALVLSFAGFFQISLSLRRQAEYGSDARDVKVEPVKVCVNTEN
ncbi:hypothetical protein AGMMS50239_20190 [Bacteroidia bacterium]|nr:hypothetical protein AGMMS50239_20190 [Bacteroidia bacterium]GHV30066.1 hypothetical protein FACS1894177_02020 [Bacteroidia bacterium]